MLVSRNRLGVIFLAGFLVSALAAIIARIRRIPASFSLEPTHDDFSDRHTVHITYSSPIPDNAGVQEPTARANYAPRMLYFGVMLLSVLLLMMLRVPLLPLLFWGTVGIAGYFMLTTRQSAHTDGLSIVDVVALKTTRFVTNHYTLVTQGTVVAAFVLLLLTAYLFRPVTSLNELSLGVVTFVAGGLALGINLRLKRSTLSTLPVPTIGELPQISLRRWPLLLGIVGIFVFSEVSGQVVNYEALSQTCTALLQPGLLQDLCLAFDLRSMNAHLQFVLLILSTALIIVSVADLDWRRGWRKLLTADTLILLLIMAVGFVLRFWGLDTTIRTLVDEVHFSSGMKSLWITEGRIGLMTPMTGLSPFPWIYPYWQTYTVSLFGRNLTGLRAVSSILGTLTIPALYLLAKAVFDRKTALLSALLLMAYPPHLHFSRVSIIQIADPLFATIGFAFLARALTGQSDRRHLDYALGGMGIAFSQYFYEAGRLLFPPLMVVWLLGLAFLYRDRLQAHRRGLAITLLVFVLLTIPVYYALIVRGYPLTGRLTASGLDANYWTRLVTQPAREYNYLEHLEAPFLFYVHQPETGSVYYGGTEPLVLSLIAPIFLLGALYTLWRLRSPGMLLLVLWILSASFGNSLLQGSAVASRYLVVFPPMALLIAVGIRYGVPLLPNFGLNLIVRYVLVGTLIVGLCAVQLFYYFGPHLDAYQWQARPHRDIQDVALRSAEFPHRTRIHVVNSLMDDAAYGLEILSFLADDLQMDARVPQEITSTYISRLPTGVDHAFFITPTDTTSLKTLRKFLVLDGPYFSPYPMPPRTQYILYYADHLKNPKTIGRPDSQKGH